MLAVNGLENCWEIVDVRSVTMDKGYPDRIDIAQAELRATTDGSTWLWTGSLSGHIRSPFTVLP
jgi:hypothetical protein